MRVSLIDAADVLNVGPREVCRMIDAGELNGEYEPGDGPDYVSLLSLLRHTRRVAMGRVPTRCDPDGDPFATTAPADAMAPADLAAALKDLDTRDDAAKRYDDMCERHHAEHLVGTRSLVEAANAQTAAMADIAKALREGTECERKAREDAAARSYSAGFAAGRKSGEREGPAADRIAPILHSRPPLGVTADGHVVKMPDAPPKLPTDKADALPRLGTEVDYERVIVVDTGDHVPGRRVISAPGNSHEQSHTLAPLFAASAAFARVAIKIANHHGYDLAYRAELVDVLKAARLIPDDAR
jgi:hypothetical protein